jgi:hypothetical protein
LKRSKSRASNKRKRRFEHSAEELAAIGETRELLACATNLLVNGFEDVAIRHPTALRSAS